jgi:adenylate cyclase
MAAEAPGLAFLDAGWVELKGMSGREPIKLLVGDEAIKSSAAFEGLLVSHTELVSALTAGVLDETLLQRCQMLAAAVEPELAQFYACLPTRLADFPPAEAIVVSDARLGDEANSGRSNVPAHQDFR